ncbi:MAG: hypothetical protein R3E87_18015 [Burkholderiaceae bacterium]
MAMLVCLLLVFFAPYLSREARGHGVRADASAARKAPVSAISEADQAAVASPPDRSAGVASPSGRAATVHVDMSPLERAEAAYRARRYEVALEQFGLVAATDDHPLAWLRIGNIWHRQGQVAMAMDAYGRARDAAARVGQKRGLRERAIMNIALLSLDQAQRALDAAGDRVGAPDNRRWHAEVELRLHELLDSIVGGASGEQHVLSQAVAPRVAGDPAERPGARRR